MLDSSSWYYFLYCTVASEIGFHPKHFQKVMVSHNDKTLLLALALS